MTQTRALPTAHLQPALFGAADSGTPAAPALASLIQTARVEAAKAADGGAVGALVARLARGDGSASVAALGGEGFPDHVIAAAVTTSGTDKRIKARARLGIVAGEPFVWLTTTGWQASGKASGRERPPSAETAEHASAPQHVGTWLAERLAPYPGLTVTVATGDPCREFSERVKALAWSRIQGTGDANGEAGPLTGGLVPDALLVERFPDAVTYAGAWGQEPSTAEDLAEQTTALEVEDSRKSDGPLRWKVERWRTALHLGAAHAVVWVVRSVEVAERLQALGVGKPSERQLLVPGHAVGLGGDPLDGIEQHWWPLRLGAAQAGSTTH